MEIKIFDEPTLQLIGKKLIANQQTIAIAESVTSGLLQFAVSTIENARKFYHGGLTAYNVAQKFKHLNVESIHAIEVDSVSEKVASEMATNVAELFNSDWGIGITGYASPTPASNNKIFAYYAISFRKNIKLSGVLDAVQQDPVQVQVEYANAVLDNFSKALNS